jgi:hypothetical protein
MSLADFGVYESYPPSVFGGGGAPKDPHIDSLLPATGVVGIAASVQVTGSNFEAGAAVELDQAPVSTAYVSATELTATFTPASAGSKAITVRLANDEESNSVPFTVTAAEEDPPARSSRRRKAPPEEEQE